MAKYERVKGELQRGSSGAQDGEERLWRSASHTLLDFPRRRRNGYRSDMHGGGVTEQF